MKKAAYLLLSLLAISCVTNNPKESESTSEISVLTESISEEQPLEIYALEAYGGGPDCCNPIDVEGLGWRVVARLIEDERTVFGHGGQWQNNTMYLYVEHDGEVVVPLKQIRCESFSEYYEKDPNWQSYIQYYQFPSFMIGKMCYDYVEICLMCAEMDTDIGFEATIHIEPDGKLSYFIDPRQFDWEDMDCEHYEL